MERCAIYNQLVDGRKRSLTGKGKKLVTQDVRKYTLAISLLGYSRYTDHGAVSKHDLLNHSSCSKTSHFVAVHCGRWYAFSTSLFRFLELIRPQSVCSSLGYELPSHHHRLAETKLILGTVRWYPVSDLM